MRPATGPAIATSTSVETEQADLFGAAPSPALPTGWAYREAFTSALVAEYRPGTGLGWHRDVPDFEDVVGVSLLSEAVMRFRPYPPHSPKRSDILKLTVEPRSIYLLRGPARWDWQHSVAATQALRYSITFRTPRPRR